MAKCSAESIASLRDRVVASKAAAAGAVSGECLFSMHEELNRLALEVVSKAVLGFDMDGVLGKEGLEELVAAWKFHFVGLFVVFQNAVSIPAFSLFPGSLKWVVASSKRTILNAVERIVRAKLVDHDARQAPRQESTKAAVSLPEQKGLGQEDSPTNLLDFHINSTEPDDAGADGTKNGTGTALQSSGNMRSRGIIMSKQQLIVETITFIAAGSGTTATLLTRTMLLLSQHPEWQEKAREEVLSLRKRGSQDGLSKAWCPTFDEIGEMKMCGWILNETLRLYPPVPMVGRLATQNIMLSNGLLIPAGCPIYCSVQMMQTNKEFWGPDADKFRPDRFVDGIIRATSNEGAFIPFGVGPRVCIGQNFALAEVKVVLALLLITFSWRLANPYSHHPELSVRQYMPVILEPLQT